MQYMSQSFRVKDPEIKDLFLYIAAEELGHMEMIAQTINLLNGHDVDAGTVPAGEILRPVKTAPSRPGMVLRSSVRYWICVITKCAETGRGPPASGVIVSAAAAPAGFCTVKTELMTVVSTIAIPTIWEAPVARPTTVYSRSAPFRVRINCPASVTLTSNNT